MKPKHIQIALSEGARAGFDAYCASVKSGQGMALPTVREKAEQILGKSLRKSDENAFKAYCKMHNLDPNIKPKAARKAAEVRGDSPIDIAQIAAEAAAQAVKAALGQQDDDTDDDNAGEYDTPRETPDDAARNAVLWRLNKEGLLSEALDASEGDYITQEAGQAVLTSHFGPLAR